MESPLKKCVEKYSYFLNLSHCVTQPLRPELDEFVKNDKTAKSVRDKVLAVLSGKAEDEGDYIWDWQRYCVENFHLLSEKMKAYTIGYGIAADLDFEVAIEHVKQEAIAFGLDKARADRIFNANEKEWQIEKADYEKEREEGRERGIAIGEERERKKAFLEKIESAKSFLQAGVASAIVAASLGLPLSEVQSLRVQ